mgnify:CR=1 FL=1|jgi:hypothetical protein
MSRKLNHTNQQIKAWVAAYYKTNGYWPTQLETRAALRCSIERSATAIKDVKGDFANGLEQALVKALAAYAGFPSLEDALTHIGALNEKPVSGLKKNDLRALVTILTGTVPSNRLTSEELRDKVRHHNQTNNTEQE